ncbi:hypothetical protein [Sulfurospirillum sp. 1612]|uniref:hypothetical protein n=1 Tax=Sulfurospirillum sp. 1612 TaxID=3094835 RepID=UPI002F9484C0
MKFIVYNIITWALYFCIDHLFIFLHIYQSTTPNDIFSYFDDRDLTLIFVNIAISLILGKLIMRQLFDEKS